MDLCSWFEPRYAHFDLNPNTPHFPQPIYFFLSKYFPQWCPRTASQRIGATHLIISGKFSSFSKNLAKIISGCALLLFFSFWISLNGLISEDICLLFNWECDYEHWSVAIFYCFLMCQLFYELGWSQLAFFWIVTANIAYFSVEYLCVEGKIEVSTRAKTILSMVAL